MLAQAESGGVELFERDEAVDNADTRRVLGEEANGGAEAIYACL